MISTLNHTHRNPHQHFNMQNHFWWLFYWFKIRILSTHSHSNYLDPLCVLSIYILSLTMTVQFQLMYNISVHAEGVPYFVFMAILFIFLTTCLWFYLYVIFLFRFSRKEQIAEQREYKKKKAQKKVQRMKELEQEREEQKSKWQQFNNKAYSKNKKGQVCWYLLKAWIYLRPVLRNSWYTE